MTNPALCQWKGSPNSRRVRIFLAEKGIELTLVPVNLGEGEQRSDWYSAINPRRVVPTLLLEDGTAIGEVPAIMRYLDEAFPEKPLLGTTPKEKGVIAMWERRMELEGVAAVMEATGALKMEIPENDGDLSRWYEAVSARPSASA